MRHLNISVIPEWLRSYRFPDIPADLAAGAVVAVVLAPQAMAYALLAGLPPVVGLYAATVPLIAYALVGSTTATRATTPRAPIYRSTPERDRAPEDGDGG